MPSERYLGKRRAQPGREDTHEASADLDVGSDREDELSPSSPKKKLAFAAALAEASQAAPAQNAASSASGSPGSALKRVAGTYDTHANCARA